MQIGLVALLGSRVASPERSLHYEAIISKAIGPYVGSVLVVMVLLAAPAFVIGCARAGELVTERCTVETEEPSR